MRRVYSWPPVEVIVEAPDDAPTYTVAVRAGDLQSAPMAVDAHHGADRAAKMALEVHLRALSDPKKFLAEERMEARHMPEESIERHGAWAENIVQAASELGDRLVGASARSKEPGKPLDVSSRIEDYLGLVEAGHEIAINTLVSEGHSPAEAREIHAQRTQRDYGNKWRLVPGRSIPTAARG